MEIYLARHGQTEWNLMHRIQGQTNTKLSPLGIQQSEDLLRALKAFPITAIYTSTLDRTIQTAQPLASYLNIPTYSIDLLNEIAFGVMEGISISTMTAFDRKIWDWWKEDPTQRRVPGGESYQDLYHRAGLFLDDLHDIEEQGIILIVGHYRINQMLLAHLCKIPVNEAVAIQQANNWIYHIRNDSEIRGSVVPTQPDGELKWQNGLIMSNVKTAS